MFVEFRPETRPDVQAAIALVGYEARPTGRLRFLRSERAGRLQQEWRGEYGTAWLDVPIVEVPEPRPRWLEATPPRDSQPSGGPSGSKRQTERNESDDGLPAHHQPYDSSSRPNKRRPRE